MSNMCVDDITTSNITVEKYFENFKREYQKARATGYAECKNDMKEIVESMAYEIASYRNPRFYTHSDDEIKSIMGGFGWKE